MHVAGIPLGQAAEGLGSLAEGAFLPHENTTTIHTHTNQFVHNTKIHNIHSKSKPKSCILHQIHQHNSKSKPNTHIYTITTQFQT